MKGRFRSSHRRCTVKKSVPKNFVKLTGNHLCQSLFLIKLQALGLSEVFKNTFSTEHVRATASIDCLQMFQMIKQSGYLFSQITDTLSISEIFQIFLVIKNHQNSTFSLIPNSDLIKSVEKCLTILI